MADVDSRLDCSLAESDGAVVVYTDDFEGSDIYYWVPRNRRIMSETSGGAGSGGGRSKWSIGPHRCSRPTHPLHRRPLLRPMVLPRLRLSGCACTDRLDCEAEQYKSIYLATGTLACAKNAASSFCRLVSDVVTGKLDNGFAVIRPPGHHAEPSLAGGYCVLNNVALGAAYAREKLGVAKVLTTGITSPSLAETEGLAW